MSPVSLPSDTEAERDLLVSCLAGSTGTWTREDALKVVLSDLHPNHFFHPHHKKVFVGLQEAVRESNGQNVSWADVRDKIHHESVAREMVRDMATSSGGVPINERRVKRLMERVDNSYRSRVIYESVSTVSAKALSGNSKEAFTDLMDLVFSLGKDQYQDTAKYIREFLPEVLAEIENRRLSAGGVVGLRTNIKAIDTVWKGLQQENFYLIGGRPGMGKCHAVGSEVSTPNGPVEIQKLEVGDEVYGYNVDGTLSPTKVVAVINNGIRPVVDISHRGRVVASCTPEHRWLTVGRNMYWEKTTSQLLSEEKRKIVRQVQNVQFSGRREEHAYAIGAALGDGCLKQGSSKRMDLSSEDGIIPNKVAKILSVPVRKNSDKNFTWNLGFGVGQGRRIACPDFPMHMFEYIRGQGSEDKHIPWEEVDSWDRESTLNLMAGLIDTDGHIQVTTNKVQIQFTSKSEKLAELFSNCVYKLWQTRAVPALDKRGCWNLAVNSWHSKRALKELGNRIALERKRYREEYEEHNTWCREDWIGVSQESEPYLAEVYDIEVDNDTHLYSMHNEGLITHNSVVMGQVAYEVAKQGIPVLLQTPEMAPKQYITRLACALAGVDYERYNGGSYDEYEARLVSEKVNELEDLQLIIDGSANPTTVDIRQNLIRFQPKLLVVDYLQQVQPARKTFKEYADVTQVSQDLNGLKKDFKIPVVAAVQLSRKVEERDDKEPQMSDLRATGQLEQDADGIFFLYRPVEYAVKDMEGNYYIETGEGRGRQRNIIDPELMKFVCAKNRHGRRRDINSYLRDGEMMVSQAPGDEW